MPFCKRVTFETFPDNPHIAIFHEQRQRGSASPLCQRNLHSQPHRRDFLGDHDFNPSPHIDRHLPLSGDIGEIKDTQEFQQRKGDPLRIRGFLQSAFLSA
jgi:hypothetical protein